jgi:tetratricopeptide (TPR) repeat protein
MSWGVKKELADLYKRIGIFMSAHELLKSVGLMEEAIKALFMAGRHAPAIEMAEEVMSKPNFRNYNLMCLMGEMKADHTYYLRAWEGSGQRCSRAMRELGRYYFFDSKMQQAVECFEKALAINRLYPGTWFTLGCAYMRLDDYQNGAYAFASCVKIDDHSQDAWANLANCYMAQKKLF